MILTPIESIKSIIVNNKHGIYVPFNDSKAISKSILFFYNDKESLLMMKKEVKILKNQFFTRDTTNFSQCVLKIIDNNNNDNDNI